MKVVTRAEWGAPPLNAAKVPGPYVEAVIHTEAGAVLPGDWAELTVLAETLSLTEKQHAQAVDRYHREVRGWPGGFGYSFMIERDGTIIEGRGWLRKGAHTQQGRNTTAVGICFAGHGDLQEASEAQWLAAAWLIGEGIRLGVLIPDPPVNGHREYAPKSCPGNKVYGHLDRLRGITGPTNPEEFTMDQEATEAFRALNKRLESVESKQDRLLADAKTKTTAIGAIRKAMGRVEAKLKG